MNHDKAAYAQKFCMVSGATGLFFAAGTALGKYEFDAGSSANDVPIFCILMTASALLMIGSACIYSAMRPQKMDEQSGKDFTIGMTATAIAGLAFAGTGLYLALTNEHSGDAGVAFASFITAALSLYTVAKAALASDESDSTSTSQNRP